MNNKIERVLQVNVDDLGYGGVFSLLKNISTFSKIKFDYLTQGKFSDKDSIESINSRGGKIYELNIDNYSRKIYKIFSPIKLMIYLVKFYKKSNYRIIHIHSDIAWKLLIYAIPARLAGIKHIVVHSHSTGIDEKKFFVRILKKILHNISKQFIPLFSDTLCSCSDLASNWMYSNFTIKNYKIHLINNGINLKRYLFNNEVREYYKTKYDLTDNYIVGNVARIDYQKNHDFLIDIFYEIKKKKKNSKLLLVGVGNLENQIRDKVFELGLMEDVIFWGSSNCVNEILQLMDVFVLPSYFEGLPLVAIEAQASGLKTILSSSITSQVKITNLVEFIPLDSNAKYWSDRILELSNNYRRENLYKDIKENGYDIEDTTTKLENLYYNLLN